MKRYIEIGDIIKFENHLLLITAQKNCKGCFFDCPEIDYCNKIKSGLFYSCHLTEETIIFKEISEIEKLILEGSVNNGN